LYRTTLPRNSGEWRHLSRNIDREAFGDYATMTAAALAFYSLLGIVPVLIARAFPSGSGCGVLVLTYC